MKKHSRSVSDSLVVILFMALVIFSYTLIQQFIPPIMKQWKNNPEQAKYNAFIVYTLYTSSSGQTNLHIGVFNEGSRPFTVMYIIANTPQSKILVNQTVPPQQLADIRINGIITPPAYLILDDGSYIEIILPSPPQYQTISV
jgi:hypothetical protein